MDKLKKGLLLLGLCLLAYTCNKGDDNSPPPPQKYTISIIASDGGNVNTSGGEFIENSSVSIVATPEQGYEFSGWTGTSLTGNSITIKVISNQTITANFIRSKYTLTIDTVGSGEVSQQIVNSARETTEYESGKTIRLSATPQSDFLFYDWEYLNNNQSDNSYENLIEIIMDQSKVVTATFEEKLPLINPNNTDKNNTVGKWKIRKKRPGSQRVPSARAVDCEIEDVIFRSDYSFTIKTQTQTITGQYTIDSETSISLYQGETKIGILTDIILTENYLSLNIDLTGLCNEQIEADKDPTYDEATDPNAPSNTGSSTIASKPCSIETELTSDNVNQTISLGDSIQNILIAVTVGSTCTETLSVSSSNLPEGISVSLDNNQIKISGTPLSNSVGTFDYNIMLSVASPTIIISGTITVENNTTTETNPNQGDGGNNSGTNTTDTDTSTNTGTTTSTTSTSSQTQTVDCSLLENLPSLTLWGDRTNSVVVQAGSPIDIAYQDWFHLNGSGSNPFLELSIVWDNDPGGNVSAIVDAKHLYFITGTPTNIGTFNYTLTGTFNNGCRVASVKGSVTVNVASETYVINVTASDSSDYTLSGADRNGNVTGNDPSVTVNVGDKIDFVVDASGHPFYLKTVQGTGTSDLISGVTNNGATDGTVSWTPNDSGTYYYQCSLHNGMYGTITVN